MQPIAFELKECAGVGTTGWPCSVVLPIPRRDLSEPDGLLLERRTTSGAWRAEPCQFTVIERWWGSDRSVRHVLAAFHGVVSKYTGSGSGVTEYRVSEVDDDDFEPPEPDDPVTVTDDNGQIVLATGAFSVTIVRSPFAIKTPAGNLEAYLDRCTAPQSGDSSRETQRSFDRTTVQLEVEESGPMRAIVRAAAPTVFDPSSRRFLHGWVIRLAVFSGLTHLKVDFQIQNASTDRIAGTLPLYFDAAYLRFESGSATSGASLSRADVATNSVVAATIRRFVETGPNEIANDSELRVSLFPRGKGLDAHPFYWLDDMRAVYKEVGYWFHGGGATASALGEFASLFNHHPVGVVKTADWANAKCTLDLGGMIPITSPRALLASTVLADSRTKSWAADYHGWDNFAIDLDRKLYPATAGGIPHSAAQVMVTENPEDWFSAEDRAMGELNVRPQWLPEWEFDSTLPSSQLLTENPYGGRTWRPFTGSSDISDSFYKGSEFGYTGYVAGTALRSAPRDDEHGWFYHVHEAYWITGNYWIRDWYRFVSQFRRVRLHNKDPFPDTTGRAIGHALSHALQAYRVTGDVDLLALARDFVSCYVIPGIDEVSGFRNSSQAGGYLEAVYQTGFLLRSLISMYTEADRADVQNVARAAMEKLVLWNLRYGNWGYNLTASSYSAIRFQVGSQHPNSHQMTDPQLWVAAEVWASTVAGTSSQIWFASEAGITAKVIQSHVTEYVNLPYRGDPPTGPSGPYADPPLLRWNGGFEGRLTERWVNAAISSYTPQSVAAARTGCLSAPKLTFMDSTGKPKWAPTGCAGNCAPTQHPRPGPGGEVMPDSRTPTGGPPPDSSGGGSPSPTSLVFSGLVPPSVWIKHRTDVVVDFKRIERRRRVRDACERVVDLDVLVPKGLRVIVKRRARIILRPGEPEIPSSTLPAGELGVEVDFHQPLGVALRVQLRGRRGGIKYEGRGAGRRPVRFDVRVRMKYSRPKGGQGCDLPAIGIGVYTSDQSFARVSYRTEKTFLDEDLKPIAVVHQLNGPPVPPPPRSVRRVYVKSPDDVPIGYVCYEQEGLKDGVPDELRPYYTARYYFEVDEMLEAAFRELYDRPDCARSDCQENCLKCADLDALFGGAETPYLRPLPRRHRSGDYNVRVRVVRVRGASSQVGRRAR